MSLKGLFGTIIETPIAGVAMNMIGSVGMGALAAPTQTFVGLGLLGDTIKNAGFKFK
jgi:hypothetical protein